jgi:hypothetical protein
MTDYEVIVGNVGSVYSGPDRDEAERRYEENVERSQSGLGFAGGETVVLMVDGEPEKEHVPSNPQEFVVRFVIRAGYADNFGEAASQLRIYLEQAIQASLADICEPIDAAVEYEGVRRHTPPCDD